jgi:hypothetical protein
MRNEERTMNNEQSGAVHSSFFILHYPFGQPISGLSGKRKNLAAVATSQ